jgi:hypothetical protein
VESNVRKSLGTELSRLFAFNESICKSLGCHLVAYFELTTREQCGRQLSKIHLVKLKRMGCYICGSKDRESGAPDFEVSIPGYGPTTCATLAEAVRDLSSLKATECALLQQLPDQLCDCGPFNPRTEIWPDNRTETNGMFQLENGPIVDEDSPDPYSPVQQISPPKGRERAVMYNQMSHPIPSKTPQSMVASRLPVVSEVIMDGRMTFTGS